MMTTGPLRKGTPRHDVGADKLWLGMKPAEVLAQLTPAAKALRAGLLPDVGTTSNLQRRNAA